LLSYPAWVKFWQPTGLLGKLSKMDILKVIETLEEWNDKFPKEIKGMVRARKGCKWAKLKRKMKRYGRFYHILSMPEVKEGRVKVMSELRW
jgi:hypothetical protein